MRFPNPAGGFELAGTLTLPEGEGPFPGVVLVAGSGPQDRDETLAGQIEFAGDVTQSQCIETATAGNGQAMLEYAFDCAVGHPQHRFASLTICNDEVERDVHASCYGPDKGGRYLAS